MLNATVDDEFMNTDDEIDDRNDNRITKELINERIEQVEYHECFICGVKMMFCGIRLRGGFVVIGQPSACVDLENWRDSIAKRVSYENAFSQIARLEAYRVMCET